MSIEEVQEMVERAGRTIFMIPGSVKPKGYTSGWPEILREVHEAYGWEKATLTTVKATQQQMSEFEYVQRLQVKLSVYCTKKRIPWVSRAVMYGMLHHPRSHKRIYSWSRLAKKLDASPPTVKGWYEEGIRIIYTLMDEEKSSVIKFPQGS